MKKEGRQRLAIAGGVAFAALTLFAVRRYRVRQIESEAPAPVPVDRQRVEDDTERRIRERGDELATREYQRALAYANRCGIRNPEQWARTVTVAAGQPCPGASNQAVRFRVVYDAPVYSYGRLVEQAEYRVERGLFPPDAVPDNRSPILPIASDREWLTRGELCKYAERGGPIGYAARQYLSQTYDIDGNLVAYDPTFTKWRDACKQSGAIG